MALCSKIQCVPPPSSQIIFDTIINHLWCHILFSFRAPKFITPLTFNAEAPGKKISENIGSLVSLPVNGYRLQHRLLNFEFSLNVLNEDNSKRVIQILPVLLGKVCRKLRYCWYILSLFLSVWKLSVLPAVKQKLHKWVLGIAYELDCRWRYVQGTLCVCL